MASTNTKLLRVARAWIFPKNDNVVRKWRPACEYSRMESWVTHFSKTSNFLQLASILQEFNAATKLSNNVDSWNLLYTACYCKSNNAKVEGHKMKTLNESNNLWCISSLSHSCNCSFERLTLCSKYSFNGLKKIISIIQERKPTEINEICKLLIKIFNYGRSLN